MNKIIQAIPIWVPICYFVLMSLIALCLYGSDKKKAKNQAWRTPEKTLLLFGFLGGAAGALLGMKIFRHKTKHWYFWAVNIAGLVWQVVLLVFWAVILVK